MHRAEEEKERQSFAKVLAELVSDGPDLDAEMTLWLDSQVDAAKKRPHSLCSRRMRSHVFLTISCCSSGL